MILPLIIHAAQIVTAWYLFAAHGNTAIAEREPETRTCGSCSPPELEYLLRMPASSERRDFAVSLAKQCQEDTSLPTHVVMNIAVSLSDLGESNAAFELVRHSYVSRYNSEDHDVGLLAASLGKQVGQYAYCERIASNIVGTWKNERKQTSVRGDQTGARMFGLLAACQHRLGKPESAHKTHLSAAEAGAYPSGDPRRPGGAAMWVEHLGPGIPIWDRGTILSTGRAGEKLVELLNVLEDSNILTTIRSELITWENSRMTADREGRIELWVQEHQNLVDVEGNWEELYLYRDGGFNPSACNLDFSGTCDILYKYKSMFHVDGHVKFSRIAPGSTVWPHSGGTNSKLRGHLGVIIDEYAVRNARLYVAGRQIGWENGTAFIFDDTYEHSVIYPLNNNKRKKNINRRRVVLLFDVFHPRLKRSKRIMMNRKSRRKASKISTSNWIV